MTTLKEYLENSITAIADKFDGELVKEHLDFFYDWKNLNLDYVIDMFMLKEPFLPVNFQEDEEFADAFDSTEKNLRYEIIKNTLKQNIDLKNNQKNIQMFTEYSIILNFFDALIYEQNAPLINSLHDNFHSLQTCSDFPLLSCQKQILIARKRLWLLLRHFGDKDRNSILNEGHIGFLSIFEEQTVCNFQYNRYEEDYIRRFQEKENSSNESN